MNHPLSRLLLASALFAVLAAPALAQDRPVLAPRALDAAKQKRAKITALEASLSQKTDAAFAGEDRLKAAMSADLKAINAEKNPQVRKSLVAAYKAKYDKDSQHLLGKARIDLQGVAGQLRAIDPSATYTVIGNRLAGKKTATAQSQPTTPPALSSDTIQDLAGADFRVQRNNDCSPGRGETTQSGGYMKSEGEGCETKGTIRHDLEVPAGKTVRVEMTASFAVEAHTISSYAHGIAGLRIIDDRDEDLVGEERAAVFSASLLSGDDVNEDIQGATLVRTLGPGRYRIEGYTESYASGQPLAWAVAEAKLQAMRVRLITPR